MDPDAVKKEELIKDAFMDMLNQACGQWESGFKTHGVPYENTFKGYDSMYLSAYENALDVAVTLGWIKKEEVLR